MGNRIKVSFTSSINGLGRNSLSFEGVGGVIPKSEMRQMRKELEALYKCSAAPIVHNSNKKEHPGLARARDSGHGTGGGGSGGCSSPNVPASRTSSPASDTNLSNRKDMSEKIPVYCRHPMVILLPPPLLLRRRLLHPPPPLPPNLDFQYRMKMKVV